MLIRIAIALGGALVVAWLGLVVYVWARHPPEGAMRESIRLMPDVVRLLRRISTDRTLPRGVRMRLWLLFAYLASPIDLVPDFVPLIGYADDVVIVAAVLRSIVRRAGPDAIRRHWPGTTEGLTGLWRAARLPGEP